jgi:hypothetical protein
VQLLHIGAIPRPRERVTSQNASVIYVQAEVSMYLRGFLRNCRLKLRACLDKMEADLTKFRTDTFGDPAEAPALTAECMTEAAHTDVRIKPDGWQGGS